MWHGPNYSERSSEALVVSGAKRDSLPVLANYASPHASEPEPMASDRHCGRGLFQLSMVACKMECIDFGLWLRGRRCGGWDMDNVADPARLVRWRFQVESGKFRA